jgi:hypothetical protein
MERAGSGQPATPITLAGTPATVTLLGTAFTTTEPDLDIAENFCASADHHAVADFRVTILMLLAGAAKGDVMQHGNVVLDHRSLADDKAGGVIKENAAADLCRRMNVALQHG